MFFLQIATFFNRFSSITIVELEQNRLPDVWFIKSDDVVLNSVSSILSMKTAKCSNII